MDKLGLIDEAIRRYYKETHETVSEDLITSILYSVDSGGKRIRPLILLDLLEGFGLELNQAHLDVAASLEMIHTGSLIHDDLPAMDNDDYRRGRLTNHKKFDEATAILAGDSLFLDPFDLLARADLKAEIIVRLVQLLSQSSGTFGMVGGQMLDMKGEGQALNLEQLASIHANKTGRLLTFPFTAAGIIAEQSEQVISQLTVAGMLIGHAFQVRDDILDVTASFEELGKTPQKDLLAEKSTYPALLGLDQSYVVLDDSLNQATAIFQNLSQSQDFEPSQIFQVIERLRLHA
ncbi:polyprenyl synthetase family protein [Streptococcus loxodontisalivarius]|uniref:Geranylgeranyl diphosphate synthase type II n=1 Tax=Streptococcus loxodontisalivarius TaxID=1349415 RepID=A0ABS2PTK1_9STRE|nr:farnesyl diphosphate synthase [Streptococcus loxodontisalivarius]MBM7643367.1 geranylgeranyl diphosphate synthase type II [Streptococcus loxodontisalivarius]